MSVLKGIKGKLVSHQIEAEDFRAVYNGNMYIRKIVGNCHRGFKNLDTDLSYSESYDSISSSTSIHNANAKSKVRGKFYQKPKTQREVIGPIPDLSIAGVKLESKNSNPKDNLTSKRFEYDKKIKETINNN